MKRLGFLLLPSVVVLGVIGIVFWAAPTLAGLPNSMANSDYSGQPSFIPPVVTPNILFIIDSTSTMQHREYEGIAFTASTTFSGLFDPMKCYTYDSTDTRFEPSATAKGAATPAVAGTCASTLWDGNFVNWLAYRRADAVKKAATGGSCVGATPPRDANANCNPSGSPAMPTITHMTNTKDKSTEAVSSATYTGRMPIPTGSPTWYFKILASGASLCGGTSSSCGSSDPVSGPNRLRRSWATGASW